MGTNQLLIAGTVAALVLLVGIGLVFFIRKVGTKDTQLAAQLYDDWSETFGLPQLQTDGKNAAAENTKTIQKYLKIVRDKGHIDEIDLRWDIETLRQDDALAWANQATEYFLEKRYKGAKGFVFDVSDAQEGNLRIFPLEKESREYRAFVQEQAILKLLRENSPMLAEIPAIKLPDNAIDAGLQGIDSIIDTRGGLAADSPSMPNIVSSLSLSLGGDWEIVIISEDTLRFVRAREVQVLEEEELVSPLAAAEQAKREAEEAEEREKRRIEKQRRKLWESREGSEREHLLMEQERAIEAKEISPLVRDPQKFLEKAMLVAKKEAGASSFSSEPGIMRSDIIGRPLALTLFSEETLDPEVEWLDTYARSFSTSLHLNLTGEWRWSISNDGLSMTFERDLV